MVLPSTESEGGPDYITILPTLHPRKKLIAVMHWHKDEWIQTRVSQPLSEAAANNLASVWRALYKLEIK